MKLYIAILLTVISLMFFINAHNHFLSFENIFDNYIYAFGFEILAIIILLIPNNFFNKFKLPKLKRKRIEK